MGHRTLRAAGRVAAALMALGLLAGAAAAPAAAQEEQEEPALEEVTQEGEATQPETLQEGLLRVTDEQVRVAGTAFDADTGSLVLILDIILPAGEDEGAELFQERPLEADGLVPQAQQGEVLTVFQEQGVIDGQQGLTEAEQAALQEELLGDDGLLGEDRALFTREERRQLVQPEEVRAVILEQGVDAETGQSAVRVALVFQGVDLGLISDALAEEQATETEAPGEGDAEEAVATGDETEVIG